MSAPMQSSSFFAGTATTTFLLFANSRARKMVLTIQVRWEWRTAGVNLIRLPLQSMKHYSRSVHLRTGFPYHDSRLNRI
jgi:hypothetical protein